jgi:DNA replication and repair protein RecF
MAIDKTRLYNFRNFSDTVFKFKENINFIYGENGSGKTNILEAINYATNFKPFNSGGKSLCIKDGEKYALIQIETKIDKIDIEIRTDGNAENRRINQKAADKEQIKSKIVSAVYTPLAIKIVYSSAAFTRSFFDSAIQNVKNDLSDIYSNYKAALLQRARVLKTYDFKKSGSEEIFKKYTEEIIKYGAEIAFYRLSFIEKILPLVNEIYSSLFFGAGNNEKENANKIEIKYISRYANSSAINKLQIKANLKNCLENVEFQEKATGLNLIGPHRDKIEFFYKGVNIEERLSTGQIQIFCLSLILAMAKVKENNVLKNKNSGQQENILLLDDVLAGLDNKVINNLFAMLQNYSQVFITNPSKFDWRKTLDKKLVNQIEKRGGIYEIKI